MTPFFQSSIRQAALWQAALPWIGTPFVDHQRVLGSGVDCVQLAAALYIAAGHVDRFEPGSYTLDHGEHSDQSDVLAWLEEHPRFALLHRTVIAPGDLLILRNGRCPHHVAVALAVDSDSESQDVVFIHCIRPSGCALNQLQDPTWSKRLAAVFTPIEP